MAELAELSPLPPAGGRSSCGSTTEAATSTRLASMYVNRGRRGSRRADGHRHSTAAARAPVRPDREREQCRRRAKQHLSCIESRLMRKLATKAFTAAIDEKVVFTREALVLSTRDSDVQTLSMTTPIRLAY